MEESEFEGNGSVVLSDSSGIDSAADVLLKGGVVVIPTDTVYGLAAHPNIPAAVDRLYTLKDRDQAKPIALLASDADKAIPFIGAEAADFGSRYWPGALTVVAQSEGVRIPNHEWTRELIRKCGGALRVTSANMSGQRPATDSTSALAEIGLRADLVVDGGVSPGGAASTVVKFSPTGELQILRPGPIKFLVLASASPRRSKILRSLGVHFTIAKTDAAEVSYHDDPCRTVVENALAKGAAVSPALQAGGVLSADTIVWFNDKIYGKPRDLNEAEEFLRELSGNTHTVFTGVAYNGEVKVCQSHVKFRTLSDASIREYVARVKPTDRAGAYDIDESGDLIVEKWTGSYENIMGLPVEPLREWGIVK